MSGGGEKWAQTTEALTEMHGLSILYIKISFSPKIVGHLLYDKPWIRRQWQNKVLDDTVLS